MLLKTKKINTGNCIQVKHGLNIYKDKIIWNKVYY